MRVVKSGMGPIKPRSVSENDIKFGVRIRFIRLSKMISQQELGNRVGLSFQQIQKYEKGVNRVGHVRLTQIAQALGEPLDAFLAVTDAKPLSSQMQTMQERITTPQIARLIDNFHRLPKELRTSLGDFIAKMADTFESES